MIPESKDEIVFCWRYCTKYKLWHKRISKNCKAWKTDILRGKIDLDRIRAAGFVLVNEKSIF